MNAKVSARGLNTLQNLKDSLRTGDWSPTKLDVDDWIIRACWGTTATVPEVINKMMSSEDMQDLIAENIPFESFKLHVKVWCEMGKPNQNIIPATIEEVKEASFKVIDKYKVALDGLSRR